MPTCRLLVATSFLYASDTSNFIFARNNILSCTAFALTNSCRHHIPVTFPVPITPFPYDSHRWRITMLPLSNALFSSSSQTVTLFRFHFSNILRNRTNTKHKNTVSKTVTAHKQYKVTIFCRSQAILNTKLQNHLVLCTFLAWIFYTHAPHFQLVPSFKNRLT